MNLIKMRYDDWIQLAQYRDPQQVLVNTVKNLQVP